LQAGGFYSQHRPTIGTELVLSYISLNRHDVSSLRLAIQGYDDVSSEAVSDTVYDLYVTRVKLVIQHCKYRIVPPPGAMSPDLDACNSATVTKTLAPVVKKHTLPSYPHTITFWYYFPIYA
jgi:hypothetical protein